MHFGMNLAEIAMIVILSGGVGLIAGAVLGRKYWE